MGYTKIKRLFDKWPAILKNGKTGQTYGQIWTLLARIDQRKNGGFKPPFEGKSTKWPTPNLLQTARIFALCRKKNPISLNWCLNNRWGHSSVKKRFIYPTVIFFLGGGGISPPCMKLSQSPSQGFWVTTNISVAPFLRGLRWGFLRWTGKKIGEGLVLRTKLQFSAWQGPMCPFWKWLCLVLGFGKFWGGALACTKIKM